MRKAGDVAQNRIPGSRRYRTPEEQAQRVLYRAIGAWILFFIFLMLIETVADKTAWISGWPADSVGIFMTALIFFAIGQYYAEEKHRAIEFDRARREREEREAQRKWEREERERKAKDEKEIREFLAEHPE